MSRDRGCIAEDGAGAFHLIGPDQDCVGPAPSKLREWIGPPDRLSAAREAAAGQTGALLDRLQDMGASSRHRLGARRSMP